jgi:hypothetical protein
VVPERPVETMAMWRGEDTVFRVAGVLRYPPGRRSTQMEQIKVGGSKGERWMDLQVIEQSYGAETVSISAEEAATVVAPSIAT